MASLETNEKSSVTNVEDTGSPRVEKQLSIASSDLDLENTRAVKGDNSDGHVDWTFRSIVATISLCGIWVGSQIPLFFVGGSLSYIVADIGGSQTSSWIPVSNTLAIASVSPFCGYMSDIFGRRNITLIGAVILMAGIIIVATAHGFSQACAGMSIIGAGAAICELVALAGISELVPVNRRGMYIAFCTSMLLPFTPYVMYSQLIGTHSTWRWTMWICLIYNGIWTIGILLTYFPINHGRDEGKTVAEILRRVDYVGAFLSITGLTLFLVALGSGGYTHPWKSAYVLCTLLIGFFLMIAFVVWESKFAPHPMVPPSLFRGNTVMAKVFLVAFVGGMNLYSLLNFFPLTFTNVFNPDPVQVGLKGLGYGISVTAGATIINGLLSVFKNHNRELLLFSTILMTAFGGGLAAVTRTTPKLAVALGTIAGFGVGGVYVPAATIAMTVAPDSLIATTVALSLAVRTLGGSIGYTIYYNVFVEKLTAKIPQYVATSAVGAGLPASSAEIFVETLLGAPANVTQVPGVTPAVLQAANMASQSAYADSLAYVWYVSIAFGACAIIASATIGNISKFLTNRIAVGISR